LKVLPLAWSFKLLLCNVLHRDINYIFKLTKSKQEKVKQPLYRPGVAQSFQEVKVPRLGKAVPLQAWSSPEGSRKLRFPY
jgi:hypothetical protein